LEAEAGISTRLSQRLSRGFGAGLTLSEVDDGTATEQFALVYATGSFAWDGANDVLNATRGARVSASAKPTTGFGDDPVGYVVVEAAASAFHPLGNRLTAAARGRVG